jgi:hypothetical protein
MGNVLKRVDNQREKALETKEILEIFLEFAKENNKILSTNPKASLNLFLTFKIDESKYKIKKHNMHKNKFFDPSLESLYLVSL